MGTSAKESERKKPLHNNLTNSAKFELIKRIIAKHGSFVSALNDLFDRANIQCDKNSAFLDHG